MNDSASQIEFETKIAFLERMVDELNEVILSQGKELEGLASRVKALENRGVPGEPADGSRDLADDRPPHY